MQSISDPILKKRAEEQLKTSEADQNKLLDNVDDGTIEGDVSDVIEGENLIEKKRAEEEKPKRKRILKGSKDEAPEDDKSSSARTKKADTEKKPAPKKKAAGKKKPEPVAGE